MNDIEHRRSRFPLFCRKSDLEYLHNKVIDNQPTLTVIKSRPQMGKTRLLVEFLYQLSSIEPSKRYIVGYAEATNEEQDLILRAVQSLMVNWTSQRSLFTEAKQIWESQRKNWLLTAGKVTACLLDTIFKESLGPASALVANTLRALVNEQSKGTVSISKLSYEQCLELCSYIYKLCARPMVIVLDAFEQLPNHLSHQTVLSKILRNCNSWPPIHIILSVRDPDDRRILNENNSAYEIAESLKKESGRVDIYDLQPLKVAEDTKDLLEFIKRNVPGVKGFADEKILKYLNGYPGVLRRWIDTKANTPEKVEITAKDALECRYPEIEPILKKIEKEQRGKKSSLFQAALYYALAPEINSSYRWKELETTIQGIDHQDAIIDLISEGLLEKPTGYSEIYPWFGLTLRYQLARKIVLKVFELHSRKLLRAWAEQLTKGDSSYLVAVTSYVTKLSQTLLPDLADQQYKLRLAVSTQQTAALIKKQVNSLR